MPSGPPPANPRSARLTAASPEATPSLATASGNGAGLSAHCWPSATPAAAPTISNATQTGPSGGVGTAARIGSAGMSPPNTVNALNVANPMCALEPTAIAAAPTTTLGRYSKDSSPRLSCPKNESVMPNSSCIVPQCTTNEAATTTHDNASRVTTPITAGRTVSTSQAGNPNLASARGANRGPTPISTPRPCTASTPQNAPSALGVWRTVITDAASCTTANDTAAMSSGPPSAEATIQRMTNHEPRGGVICAVVRAVAQTIAAAGTSGSTPNCWPAIDTGTRCTASHMLATAPSVPVRSLLATTNWTSVIAAMMASATREGPNATRARSRDCGVPEEGEVPVGVLSLSAKARGQ